MRWNILLVIAAGLLVAAPPQLSAQGFGMIKMHANLQRRRPPDVYLMGTAIDVRVDATDPGAAPLRRDFETLLANEMCRNDSRLHVDRNLPETIVEVTVTTLNSRDNWISKKSTEYKKVGTKQVWNDKKQAYETKDSYDNVEVTKRYLVVDGAATATVRVVERASNRVLHTTTLNDSYHKEFLEGNGAPLAAQVPVQLMQSIVHRILPSVVPTFETVQVQLAKGKLEDSSKLAQSGLWTRMLETLETMPPLTKKDDDAYRSYNLGVASEALAYAAEDPSTAQKLLEQAAIYYGKAIDQKPDEKYFREPQIRIQTAIAHAGKMEGQRAMYTRSLEAKKSVAPVSSPPGGSRSAIAEVSENPAAQVLNNRAVIELVASGLDEANLIAMIRESPAVQFDLSAQGTLSLLQNKVTNKVIAAMRERVARK